MTTVASIGSRVGLRVLQTVVVAVFVTVIAAVLVRLAPGDAATTLLGDRATSEGVARLQAQLGLDRSVLAQVGETLGNVARGDLGTSLTRPDQPVSRIVLDALPVTLSVIAAALLVAVVVGVPLGLIAGTTRRPALDRGISLAAIGLLALPSFFLAIIAILVLALTLGIAPAGGWGGGWPENLKYLWLPALSLAVLRLPQVVRVVREAAREASSHEYVEAAVARGLSPRRVTARHVLPNCLLPMLALVGFDAAVLLSGAVVVESIFGLPGFGRELVTAVGTRDYPTIQGIALTAALFVVLVNLVVDALYALADPRVRTSR